MINLDKGTEQLDKADNFLTKLKTLLKRHWGILLLIGVGVLFYFIFTASPNEEEYYEEPINDTYYEEPIQQGEEYYEEPINDTYYEEPINEGYHEEPTYQEEEYYEEPVEGDEGYY